tara:strand:+ start:173 stop:1015 length:843 start_codon:yes stop_codon:yes gene_type:complete
MNYRSILNMASKELKENSIKSFLLDSEILLSKALNISREKVLINLEREINESQILKFIKILEKRKKSEPIAYILGKKEFWKTDFYVNSNVLIPRPETEIIVEEAIKIIKNNKYYQLLDIGTGSGCIIISMLKEIRNCKGTGIDSSLEAIKVAKTNAKIQQLENRVKFIHSDIDNFLGYKYDMIVSNPPYINSLNLSKLDKDVQNYEPKLALDGGLDGISEIKKVVKKSSKLIKKKGTLILEIGSRQFDNSKEILEKNGFYIQKVLKDLSKKKRGIVSIKI